MQDLTSVNSRSLPVRVLIAAAIIFALAFAWFAVRWQLGSMLTVFTAPDKPGCVCCRGPRVTFVAIRSDGELAGGVDREE